ncbi:hypothetical protein KY330_00825 [Candidatus Woesearchaeota archaeon]|nr:hypothetical protein [Candidatus Woesearchaeota archaeon]
MFKMDVIEIIAKIKENSGLSEGEINARIDKKLNQLSGLISKEGAAHIVANELGVKLFEQLSGKLQVKNVLPGLRNVEIVGKVQRVFDVKEFKVGEREGKVLSMVVGDETGVIRAVLWNDQVDLGKNLKEGDIVRVSNAYVKENQGRKEIHLNDKSKLEINPPGESVGEVSKVTAVRKKVSELKEAEDNVEILGTIVQAFDLRFFEVCPNCGKRARSRDDGFYCDVHNKVEPEHSYVMNAIIDDGTDNIRCVFFKNQVQNLLQLNDTKIQAKRTNPDEFDVEQVILGQIIKLIGRVTKNQMFDRVEFVSQMVFHPKPEEEL